MAQTAGGEFTAAVVVNVAGAWGDRIAALAGVAPVGLQPKRRTAILVEVPGGAPANDWPAAIHVGETFYFKPDAGLLLVSPADETPSERATRRRKSWTSRWPPTGSSRRAVRRSTGSGAAGRACAPSSPTRRRWSASIRSRPASSGWWAMLDTASRRRQRWHAAPRHSPAGEPLAADLLDQGVDPALLSPGRLHADAS